MVLARKMSQRCQTSQRPLVLLQAAAVEQQGLQYTVPGKDWDMNAAAFQRNFL